MSHRRASLLRAQVLLPHARLLAREGAPVERLFERCGISPDAVRDPKPLITMQQGYQLAEESAQYAGAEDFSLQAGRLLQLEDLGAIGVAVQQAPTLFDAGRLASRAIRVSAPGSLCWIEQHGPQGWFCYRPGRRFQFGGVQAELFDLSFLLKFIRLAAGANWAPQTVRTVMVTHNVLRSDPDFSEAAIEPNAQTTAIAFPRRLLARRLITPSVIPGPGTDWRHDEILRAASGTSATVTCLLKSALEHERPPTLALMAERLGMNCRTFQRALAREGATYRHLTESLLFGRAAALLETTHQAVKRISAELGYSSPNSFVRAFRRIAGVTPGSYRKEAVRRSK